MNLNFSVEEYLEAFSTIVSLLTNDRTGTVMGRKELSVIEQALLELRSIKEAEPSKALEELNRIDCNITYLLSDCDISEEVSMNFNSIRDNKSCEIIKQALQNAQREHRLLEIVKEKVMNLVSISDGRVWDGELYQSNKISEEESVLLKGWKNE